MLYACIAVSLRQVQCSGRAFLSEAVMTNLGSSHLGHARILAP